MAPYNPRRGSGFRPIQIDLNTRLAQQAHNTGQALQEGRQAVVDTALGFDTSNPILALVQAIKENTDIDVALKTIKLGFQGFTYTLTANQPLQIIRPAKSKRGYIILNPAETASFANPITFFASAARAAGVYTSSAFNVSVVDRMTAFLDVTANAGGGTLVVNAQTRDPVSGNWATSQADIFAGAAAVGTYQANLGQIGIDDQVRLVATVAVAAVTFSASGFLKGSTATPQGSTIYLGDSNVTSVFGYPILLGQREFFFLDDNVDLYAISPNALTIKVFQLQGA